MFSNFFLHLFGSDFMPHVYCLRDPAVVGIHVVSDTLIAVSYFAIPLVLLVLLRRRRDLVFPWMFSLFGLFIFACGFTHLLAVWTLWHPIYRFEGVIKAITAVASCATAFLLYRLMPRILTLPSPAQFQIQMEERRKAEAAILRLNQDLESRVQLRTDELAKSNRHLQSLNEDFRKSELRYRTLVEAMPQLVWTADDSGRCEYLSTQWSDYTGLPMRDQVGLGWIKVIHPDDREPTLKLFLTAVEEKREYIAEYRIRKHDGTYHWFKARGIRISEPTMTDNWLGTCTDIDAEKLARTALVIHNRHLEDLAFATAHHLQEPLRNLSLQSQLLVREAGSMLGEAGKELIDSMNQTTRRLQQLLKDFLAYSEANMAPLDCQTVDLKELIDDALLAWRGQLEQVDATLFNDVQEEKVEINARAIQTVLEQLLSNAIKYRDLVRPLKVKVTSFLSGNEIMLCVEDNGIGIDSRFHETIFGLFKRLHTAWEFPGTGLGLALCQRILELHGQRIWTESELGVGSKFCLTLRRAETVNEFELEAQPSLSGRQSF